MKSIKHIFGVTALATLTACGGGGSGGDSGNNNTQPAVAQFDVAPFLGIWTPVDLACTPYFEYNQDYYSKQSAVTFSTDGVEVIEMVYTDKECNVKAGKLTEIYSVVYAPGSALGKSMVAKIDMTLTSATTSADGGTGMTLTKVPEGTHAVGSTFKDLLAIEGSSLYMGENSGRDADGYPTTLYPEVVATR